MKVAVLMGGHSSERNVSLESGKGVLKALLDNGHKAFAVDVVFPISGLVSFLEEEKPDVVFNALHGKYGEDGCVQGLLNLMKIPYTHSGVLASAVSMDKQKTKIIASSLGIDVPDGKLICKENILKGGGFKRPYVVKPNNEGSSVGVSIIHSVADEEKLLQEWVCDVPMLLEEYIAGREVSVVVLDDGAVGVVEIKPNQGFYDYQTKYTIGAATHQIPAEIDIDWTEKLKADAYAIHQALGCRGVSRSDFRLDEQNGRAVFLELNANPGMTPLSLVPEVVLNIKGMSYGTLVEYLLHKATYEG